MLDEKCPYIIVKVKPEKNNNDFFFFRVNITSTSAQCVWRTPFHTGAKEKAAVRHHTRAEGTSTSAVQHGIYRAWLTACSATWERVRDMQSSPLSFFSFLFFFPSINVNTLFSFFFFFPVGTLPRGGR